MDQSSITPMVDIQQLPIDHLPHNLPMLPVIVISTIFFILLLLVLVRRYRSPTQRIQRQLVTRQISARQVAHNLAQVVRLNQQQSSILDEIRFSRVEPDYVQIDRFIREIQSD